MNTRKPVTYAGIVTVKIRIYQWRHSKYKFYSYNHCAFFVVWSVKNEYSGPHYLYRDCNRKKYEYSNGGIVNLSDIGLNIHFYGFKYSTIKHTK